MSFTDFSLPATADLPGAVDKNSSLPKFTNAAVTGFSWSLLQDSLVPPPGLLGPCLMCPLVLPLVSPSLRGHRRFALALAGCPLLPTTSGTLRNGTPAAASLGDRNPLRWHRGLHFRRCPRAAGAPRRRGPPPLAPQALLHIPPSCQCTRPLVSPSPRPWPGEVTMGRGSGRVPLAPCAQESRPSLNPVRGSRF